MSAPNQLSFLPEDYLDRKAQRRTNVICAVLAAIVMAAIGSAFHFTEKMNRDAEARHDRVQQDYSEAARQIAQVQQVEQKQQRMARQAELASSLLEKIPRSIVLAEVTNSVPKGVSLQEFLMNSVRKVVQPPPTVAGSDASKAAASGPPQPQPIAYDVTFKVSGIAGDNSQVAEFIRQLSDVPIFKDVNLVISDEISVDDKKILHFQVEMTLNGAADVATLGSHRATSNTTALVPAN